jgi:hypothetical protein
MLPIKSSLLAACLVLFFMPFVEIKCNEEALIKASAMDLAFARPLKINTPAMFEQYLGESEEMKEAMSAINSKERKPDVLLIAYLICLIVSAVLLFVPKSKTQIGYTLAAVLAMLLLFCFYWIYNKGWEEKMTGEFSVLPMVKLSLQFGWALWVSMLLLFAFSTLGIVGFFSKRKDSALEIYTPNGSRDQDLKEDD